MTDRRRLRDGARSLGIELDDDRLDAISLLLERLYERNEHVNLTRVPVADAVPLLVLDSLTLARALPIDRAARVLDVGCGAGFPGLPLAICSRALDVALLDATRKKLDFVDALIRELEIENARTAHARAEELAHDAAWRERFDLATAKAVARLDVLVEYLLPFVAPGGVAVALKGREIEAELELAAPRVEALGGRLREVIELVVPTTDIVRRLVVVEKVSPTESRYPRENRFIKQALKS